MLVCRRGKACASLLYAFLKLERRKHFQVLSPALASSSEMFWVRHNDRSGHNAGQCNVPREDRRRSMPRSGGGAPEDNL
jgi:hypothetical protein